MKKIKWECKEGHIWFSKFSRANPHWCPYCSGKFNNNILVCQKYAEERGGKCLSEKYVTYTKMNWECKEGHIWKTVFVSMKSNNSWCPECGKISSANKRRGSIEECHNIAKERGGKCLSKEYVNINTKMNWECKKGHIWGGYFWPY